MYAEEFYSVIKKMKSVGKWVGLENIMPSEVIQALEEKWSLKCFFYLEMFSLRYLQCKGVIAGKAVNTWCMKKERQYWHMKVTGGREGKEVRG